MELDESKLGPLEREIYRKAVGLLEQGIDAPTFSARFERETRSSSGRLTVVVPRSLHGALKGEAANEGVSLSELIRLKLAVPYRQMTELLAPRKLGA